MRSSHRSALSILATLAGLGAGIGCVADEPPPSPLELTRLDHTTIAGSLVAGESTIDFESSSTDQRTVVLHLDVNGAALDFTYDTRGLLTEEGHQNVLRAGDLTALLDLRDAINRAHPEAVQGSLQGMFLSRQADWLADASAGYGVETRVIDVQDRLAKGKVANTTSDDSSSTSSCLRPGVTYTAFFDAGNGGTQWTWNRVANSGSCLGRCGAGCNVFDTDLMLDCFEHDSCVDHFGGSVLGDSPNCGDEFSHAVAEYTVTLGAWCPF